MLTYSISDVQRQEQKMHRNISRRNFLKSATISFPFLISPSALGNFGAVAPSEKIAMGFIGVGSMGGGHMMRFSAYDDVQPIAMCDVRQLFRQRAGDIQSRRYNNPDFRTYSDFRELLARKDIDAVTVVTPEHWHALIGIEAARQGKSMYYEKPLDIHVAAGKALRRVVKEAGVTFQFGTQQRSDDQFRHACELARNGRLGKLHTIMVGSLPSGYCPNQPSEPLPDKKVFDYDMWLGPAKWAPYSYERAASRAMRTNGWWTHIYDYSLGGLSGAWGIHHVDIAQWGNGTDHTGPLEVEGWGTFPEDGLADTAIEWEVAHTYANGVTMIHMDRVTALQKAPQFDLHYGNGILFLGDAGWVFVCRDLIDASPKSLLGEVIGPEEIQLYRSRDHRRNLLDCIRSGNETICPVEQAVRSDTICHLDDIAMRLGRKLHWNPEREEFIGDDEANRMLTRPMRSPWHL
jgi:predicted dehydrogenase